MITAVPKILEKRHQDEGYEQVSIAEKGSMLNKSCNSKDYQIYYCYKHKNIYEEYLASGFTVMGVTHPTENDCLAISQQLYKKIIHTIHRYQEQPFLGKNTIFQCPAFA